MKIHLLRKRANDQQVREMLGSLETYIKVAVDVERRILAGGGELHADCEAVLIGNGSRQENIWGADWIPSGRKVIFQSLINMAPQRNNPSMEIQDPKIRSIVETIVRNLLDIS